MPKRQIPGLDLWSFWDEGADFKAEMDPNLATLSVVVQGAAKSRTTVLPGSGLAGDIYIVRDDAVSNANEIAYWDGPSGAEVWKYLTPKEGWRFWVNDEDKLYVWSGSAWVEFEQGSGGGGSSGPSDTGYVARNARFWALLDLESGGTEVSAVQMEVRGSIGGSELVVTPSASSEDGANVALNAYDDDGATYWRSSGDNGQARFIYDAGLNGGDPLDPIQVNVAEIAITARGGGGEAEAPTRFILAYADDNGVWVPVVRIVTDAWSAGETKTFDVSAFTKRVEIAADDLRLDSDIALTSGAYESTGLDMSDKDGLIVFFDQLDVDTSDATLDLTLFVGGVEVTSGYRFFNRNLSTGSGSQEDNYSASGTDVQLTGAGSTWGLNAANNVSGYAEIKNSENGEWKFGRIVLTYTAVTGAEVFATTDFLVRSAGALTGWKIATSAGNITSGSCRQRLIEASAFGASETQAAAATTFLDLIDTPGSYTANALLKANAAGDGVIHSFVIPESLGTPGQYLGVNTGATALEWKNFTFLGLSDTPGSYTANKLLKVNAAGDAVVEGLTVPASIGTAGQVLQVNAGGTALEWGTGGGGGGATTESIIVACSDETTDLTTGTAKVTFRIPYAFTLTEVRASVTTAPTGAALTVDINEGGVSILSTKLTIDAGEKTSTTAATAAVISDTALADDAEMTVDIDQVGSTVAGAGLKITLIGSKT